MCVFTIARMMGTSSDVPVVLMYHRACRQVSDPIMGLYIDRHTLKRSEAALPDFGEFLVFIFSLWVFLLLCCCC